MSETFLWIFQVQPCHWDVIAITTDKFCHSVACNVRVSFCVRLKDVSTYTLRCFFALVWLLPFLLCAHYVCLSVSLPVYLSFMISLWALLPDTNE